jgi:hypothetical protein
MAIENEDYNPATSALLSALAGLGRKLDKVVDGLERRERPAPAIFKLTSVPKSTSLRFRIKEIVFVVSAAGVYGLRVGTADVFQFQVAGADSKVFPFPELIDSGKDISVSGAAGNIVDAYITFYPEMDTHDRSR